MASAIVEPTSEAEQAADLSDQKQELPPYLPIGRALLCFGHPLVHVEHPGNVQLDAVQVTADDSPYPEQASLAGLTDLKRKHRSYSTPCPTLS